MILFASVASARVNVTCHDSPTPHTMIVMTVTVVRPRYPRVRRWNHLRSSTVYPMMSAPTIAPAPSSAAFSARVGPSKRAVFTAPW